MVKVNIIHMWDFTVMPLQKLWRSNQPTRNHKKQYLSFPLLAIFFPAKNCHIGTGGKKRKNNSFKEACQTSKPPNCNTVKEDKCSAAIQRIKYF